MSRNNTCPRCTKRVYVKSKAIQCHSCSLWIHLGCDKRVSYELYNCLVLHQTEAVVYICTECSKKTAESKILTHDKASQTTAGSKPSTQDKVCQKNTSNDKTMIAKGLTPRNHNQGNESKQAPQNNPHSLPTKKIKNKSETNGATPDHRTTQSKPTSGTKVTPKLPTEPKKPAGKKETNEPRVSNKSTSTPKLKKQATAISNAVIIFNTEESTSASLECRRAHDYSIWESICISMELKRIAAVNIYRLNNKIPGTNRPLKIELEDDKTLEKVLLSIPLLDKMKWGNIKIKRDIPWTERETIRTHKLSQNLPRQKNSVIARGIPEGSYQSNATNLAHDMAQWEFIKHTLTEGQVIATSVVRLPRPSHLASLQQPKLLRITLATEEMANIILQSFEHKRRLLDPNIKIHLCRPRDQRTQQRQLLRLPNLHPTLKIAPISISTPMRPAEDSKAFITPEKKKQ